MHAEQFVGLDPDWKKHNVPPRDWQKIQEQTQELWDMAKHPDNISWFDTQSSEYGIHDSLNLPFVKEIQELHQDNTARKRKDLGNHKGKHSGGILEYCDELETKYRVHMFNPFLWLLGFNGHLDMPVKFLHVVLLGIIKYLYHEPWKIFLNHSTQKFFPNGELSIVQG
ncbi:hypothetical protein CROQUDRAFT_135966 [Cronartium quercuum f. sp. fusiforme G11]|uniref:Uncharacterized protein n=1 Tax=Cronartium quercuum f. sp. fusiforme G11 TaxID=708437 RepID=A0A9P6NCP3_9BASI|nr:hypothetical protein CROQUDRAFT_135966 [Cronartium quercuum f. sp. fusiforme G11]